jgi:hypothetical protein
MGDTHRNFNHIMKILTLDSEVELDLMFPPPFKSSPTPTESEVYLFYILWGKYYGSEEQEKFRPYYTRSAQLLCYFLTYLLEPGNRNNSRLLFSFLSKHFKFLETHTSFEPNVIINMYEDDATLTRKQKKNMRRSKRIAIHEMVEFFCFNLCKFITRHSVEKTATVIDYVKEYRYLSIYFADAASP